VEYTWGKTKISIKKRYLRPEDIITTLATYLKESEEKQVLELAKDTLLPILASE